MDEDTYIASLNGLMEKSVPVIGQLQYLFLGLVISGIVF